VRVDASPAYGNDPGKPGYGTIVAVITDGARLFSTSTPAPSYAGYFFRHLATPRTQIASLTHPDLASFFSLGTPTARVTSVLHPAPLTVASGTKRYSFYTTEMHLLAETALTTSGAPTTAYEYIWFNGHPIAQIDAGAATHWTFTDHLGTPILLTNTDASTYWRAEYEPFGAIYALRSADVHQPLRLPGQEAEQLNLGANGVTEREYNIHRWYRSGWGRYTQSDPIGLKGGTNLFGYVFDNPARLSDPLGLRVRVCCKEIPATLIGKKHCYFEFDDGPYLTAGFHLQNEENISAVVGAIGCMGKASVAYDHGFDTDTSNPGTCGPWANCNSDCVRQRAAQYGTREYCLLGPNSNTFASFITKGCGLKPPPASVTNEAPGWNDMPPPKP
jgi:RHS repeat-associated protein